VSASSASPAAPGSGRGVRSDPVRALQHVLYRAAKADPGRRFHALYDKVHRRDVLQRAWAAVRRNSGAPGIDKITLGQVEEYGVDRLLGELASELREGRYRPLPARRVFIPKPGAPAGEQRPLSIPAVRDRIVQAAVKIVLEPVFEADFLPCSFGFRPGRSPHDALQVLIDECARGRRWVVETDIASCFAAIPHDKLMQAVEERVCDQPILKLLRAMLRAGVMQDGQVQPTVAGTPQGGVVSPVLCNVYLHRLDRAWDDGDGVLVRFADDLVVMCWSRSQAEAALARLTAVLAGLGLEPKPAKTRIVHLEEEGGGGFDFLGFHHRMVRSRGLNGKKPALFLARWPSDKAMQHARDRIRDLTARSRLRLWPELIADDLNRFLRGWAACFRFGNSTVRFGKISYYARMRMALFIARRARRSRGFGWAVLACRSPDQPGLITLSGIVVAPYPFKDWRVKPNAAGERRR
jgi:RNA-directed DNA polymerase